MYRNDGVVGLKDFIGISILQYQVMLAV